jgi:subtilisin family serine protease
MNNKLKWLLFLIVLGGATITLVHRRSGQTAASPQAPAGVQPATLSKNRTKTSPPVSPATTPTATLSRFPEATLVQSQEAQDLSTSERIVTEIIKVPAKYPLLRVETRFQPSAVQSARPRVIEAVADQVLVTASADVSDAALEAALRRVDGKILQMARSDDSRLVIVGLPNALPNTVPDAVEALSAFPQTIQYVEPHFVSRAQVTPNDPRLAEQWSLDLMQMERAWDIHRGSATVVVAVLDTGVDYNHPELQGRIWRNPGEVPGNLSDDDINGFMDDWQGIDFAYGDTNPLDDQPDGHGTFVSGLIAATPNNDVGIAGVCWNVRIMPVKIIDRFGLLYTFDEVQGMDYARTEGAHIVNMSLGGAGWSRSEYDAIGRLKGRGILVTCSAGNEGDNSDVFANYPSSYDHANIVSVGFSDSSDTPDFASNYGRTSVDLFAPGRDVLSLERGGGYRTGSGSSFSAPYAAGVAALLKAQNPSWNFVQIKSALLSHVDYLPSMAGKCVSNGRLNAYESLIPKTGLTPALESGSIVWQTGGDRPWHGQLLESQDGVDAASSGNIANSQSSWLQTTVTGPGRLSFWWRVSCELSLDGFPYDYLEFVVDGVTHDWIDGETAWEQQVWDLPAGTHTLRWRYTKDSIVSEGEDKGFLDLVTFQADTGPPALQITAPTGSDFIDADLNLSGTATDQFDVQSVEYRLENSSGVIDWQPVTQNPDWNTWTLSLTGLPPGTNLVRLRATDAFGRVGALNRVFTRLIPLQVDLVGCGTLSPNLVGTTYHAPGKALSIKATPCAGHLFSQWTRNNGAPVASLTLNFTMQEGLQLTAYIVTNEFLAARGGYNGLFYDANGVLPASAGYFSATLTTTGTFTGRLQCEGQTNIFRGKFQPGLNTATATVARTRKASLTLALQLDAANQQITGTVTAPTWQSALLADRAPFSAGSPTPFAGRYTFVLPGSLDSSTSPGGSTYGSATVAATGKITLQGRSADNQAFSQITSVSGDGDWPLYVSLSKGKGVLAGWMKLLSPPDLTNQLVSLVRLPIATARLYPNGFTNDVTAAGSPYVYVRGAPVLAWSAGQLILSGGEFAEPITNSITLTSANKILNNGPHVQQISLNPTNGIFSGTFRPAGTARTYSLYGAIVQNIDIGLGFFFGTNTVGEVRLQAAP